MPATLSRKSAIQGLRVFIILSLTAFILIFYLTGSRDTLKAIGQFRFEYFLLALLLVGVDFSSAAGRIYVFIRKLDVFSERRALWTGFEANLANLFMAAVTPFGTGGGLAQIYVVNLNGAPLAYASSSAVMNFVATIIVLLASGPVVMNWLARTYADFQFRFIFTFTSHFFYFVAVLFFILLVRPQIIATIAEWLLSALGRMWKKKRDAFQRGAENFHRFIGEYQRDIITFWKNEKLVLFHNLWITALHFINKCVIAYVVLLGMGLRPPFFQVIAIQLLLIFLVYFGPTPGAAFLAETSAAALMSMIIPTHLLPLFSILWRFFTTHIGIVAGGIVLMRVIGKKPQE